MVYASSMYSAGGISYDIVAVDRTKEAIDSATQGIDNLNQKTTSSLSEIIDQYGLLAIEIGAVTLAAKEAFDSTVGASMALADELKRTSDITGISTEDLQRLKDAGVATGVGFDSISTSLRFFMTNIADAGASGEALRAKLADIGVTVYDSNGNWKDANTLYWETIKATSEMSNVSERNILLKEAMGRSYFGIIPLVNDYAEAERAAAEEEPFSDGKIDQAHRMEIAIDKLNDKLEKSRETIGMELLPATEEWVELLDDWTGKNTALGTSVSYLNTFLEDAARGFKLAGYGAKEFWQIIHGDFEGAKATGEESANWMMAKVRDDALVAAGFETDGMGNVIAPKKTAEPNKYVDPSQAAKDAKSAKETADEADKAAKKAEEERVDALVSSYKEYQSAIEKANDAKKKLYDLDQSFAMDMQNAGMDVAAGRRAYQSYQKSRIGVLDTFGEAQMGIQESVTEFNAVQSGTPLEQVKGTEQYEKAQATTIGQITIENINLSQDYTANDFMNDLTAGRIAKGVPLAK